MSGYSTVLRDVPYGPPYHIVGTIGTRFMSAYQASALPTASSVWPSASMAIYVPIRNPWATLLRKMVIINGTAVSGNFDVGIYDAAGTKLWSSGSTAQSGTQAEQVVDVSPDIVLTPGLLYAALALDNTTGRIFRSDNSVQFQCLVGIFTEASAFPLPTTATFALNYTNAYQPYIGLALEATVA